MPDGGGDPESNSKDFGTWSSPQPKSPTPEPPPSPKNEMTRKEFLTHARNTVAGVVAHKIGRNKVVDAFAKAAAEAQMQQETSEQEPTENSPTYIIDYFGDQTEEATKERLIALMHANLSPLNAVDFSNFEERDHDEITRAIILFQQIGASDLLARLVLDKAVEIAGSHGDFVTNSHLDQLNELVGPNEGVQQISLQNSVENYRMEVDELGNITATLILSKDRVQDSFPEGMDDSGVAVEAFQFGEITLNYTHTAIRDPIILDTVSEEGELYFVWGTEGLENTLVTPVRTEDGIVIHVNGVPTENFVKFEGENIYNNREVIAAVDSLTEKIKKERYDQVVSGELTDEQRSLYVETVPVESRVTYVEPYNSQENLDIFFDHCDENPDLFIVHAMGNNTDARNLEKRETDNGILISGFGGSMRARMHMFGSPRERSVGGIGADLYVDYHEFHDELQEEGGVMSSSEATGRIGAYAKVMRAKGMSPAQIKRALINDCSDFIEADDINNNFLFIGDGSKISGNVFNKEKADIFVRNLG